MSNMMQKVQKGLLSQAFNSYCFGYEQGQGKVGRMSFIEFCAKIKVVNETGKKLSNEPWSEMF